MAPRSMTCCGCALRGNALHCPNCEVGGALYCQAVNGCALYSLRYTTHDAVSGDAPYNVCSTLCCELRFTELYSVHWTSHIVSGGDTVQPLWEVVMHCAASAQIASTFFVTRLRSTAPAHTKANAAALFLSYPQLSHDLTYCSCS